MQVFMGRRRQRGHGIGSVISGAFKSLLPAAGNLLKSLGSKLVTNVGSKALSTGANIATDILAGKRPSDALRSRLGAAGSEIARNPLSLLSTPSAAPPQPPPPPPPPPKTTKKTKRKPLKRKLVSSKVRSSKGSKKSRRVDILDD